MKTIKVILSVSVLAACCLRNAEAQSFSSGSDGSYGSLNITGATTLDLPPDGKFRCTSIFVSPSGTLKFKRNALNTPVYLLATSNVVIQGSIVVAGENGVSGGAGLGGPGGFDGGTASMGVGAPAGDGLGPGKGKGGDTSGDFATAAGSASYGSEPPGGSELTNRGVRYGNTFLVPIVGGSGGGGATESGGSGGWGGGGGGGALMVASDTEVVISGLLVSNGGSGFRPGAQGSSGGGSGGAIRIVAPKVSGNGTVHVGGGTAFRVFGSHNAGFGRIRIDTLDRSAMLLSFIGNISIGRFMVAFPAVIPRLDIIEAAGTIIPQGTNSDVNVTLPLGSPTNQTVRIQARDFQGIVPISVVVTPENGPSTTYAAEINMGAGPVAETNLTVAIPPNTVTRINAWTR